MDGSNYGIVAKKDNRAAVILTGLPVLDLDLDLAMHRGVGRKLTGKIHQIARVPES